MENQMIKNMPRWPGKLAIASVAALLMMVMVLVLPSVVRGDPPPPDITAVEVTSSKSAYFYSPPLPAAGGTVYFNNNGEGADQVVTVTVTLADDDAVSFEGGEAFGITPSTTVSNTDGTWSVAYTIQLSDSSESGVVFTVTDSTPETDNLVINFVQDITAPGTASNLQHVADTDSGGDGFAPDSDWEDDLTVDLTWNAASDPGGSGVAGYVLSSSAPVVTDFYTTTSGSLTVTQDGAFNLFVRAKDNVGNEGTDQLVGPIQFDRDAPVNGRLDLFEVSGGQYLYTADYTDITSGLLYYNNDFTSSFSVTAEVDGTFNWGAGSTPWKVAFSEGWGQSLYQDTSQPFTHTYTINPPESTSVFTVYYINRAGNALAIPIDAQVDTTPPQVTFSNVTDPHYDPDGDELDDGEADDNWYRTSLLTGGWSFSSLITETQSGVSQSYGYWNHSVPANNQSIAAPGGSGTFTNVSDDSDGTVQVTLVVTDQVNNAGNVTLEIQLDGTPPGVTANNWAETSSYMTLQGSTLYYNADMPSAQIATVSGTASDGAGSGLNYAAFQQKANLTSSPVSDTTASSWSSNYSFNSATGLGASSVQVTVYDHVGNSTLHTYNYFGTNDQPSLAFDNVTMPGYDAPANNRLDDVGNWYAAAHLNAPPGNGWWFSAAITPANSIAVPIARATWNHASGPDYAISPTPSSGNVQGTFTDVADDPSGLIAVTLIVTDDLNRSATDTLLIRIDKEGPAVTGDGWTESSNYLYVNGSTLYFSDLMGTTPQVATLSGTANDGPNGTGVESVTFSNEEAWLGASVRDTDPPEDWSIVYNSITNSSSDGGSPVQVTILDYLGNQTVRTYSYVEDTAAPSTPSFTSPSPGYYNTQSLATSWSTSSDSESQLQGYYLGATNPPLGYYPPGTTSTTFDFGSDGTFDLYLMAQDNVGNQSSTSAGPFTIDTQSPAPWVQTTPDSDNDRILVEWGATELGTWVVDYDVEYRVGTGGSWTTWFNNTSAESAYFGPTNPVVVELETPYYFRVRARDYVDNQSDWSAQASGGIGLRKVFLPILFKNLDGSIPFAVFDGFETGAFVGWYVGGALPSGIVTSPLPPGGGSYAALLGSPSYGCGKAGNVPVGQAFIKAYASVPSGGGTPYLRFDYRVYSYDTVRSTGGEWWDRLEVNVKGVVLPDNNGTGLGDSNPYGDPDTGGLSSCTLYDSGWQQAEMDLSAYAGQMVLLTFFNENHKDSYYNTYTYLDNIRIEVD